VNEGLRTREGGRIERSRVCISASTPGLHRRCRDTLASDAARQRRAPHGRSFRYHRPRGVLHPAPEPNRPVAVRRDAARYTPNLRATQLELYEGLEAPSQNRWPSLPFDLGAVNDLLSPFIPGRVLLQDLHVATARVQSLYEPRIRAAAGLGRLSTEADPDRYASRYAHCDVLIAGAGPAGLAAARGRRGERRARHAVR